MRFSIFIISCCVFLLGCSANYRSSTDDFASGVSKVQEFKTSYGEINNSEIYEYLNYITNRLVNKNAKSQSFQVLLVNSSQPFAFAPGGRFLIISKGLILKLANEAELAFVISHELSHYFLNHTRLDLSQYNAKSKSDKLQDLENEADQYGLGLLAIAGYDPYVAIKAISTAYWHENINDSHYLPAADREQKLLELVENSHWQPPGTIDRREFQIVKNKLFRY